MTTNPNTEWLKLCNKSDLVPNTGVAALYQDQQIAIFYIPEYKEEVFAIGNQDPFSGANVLARGLVGDIKGELMVASPLYKQHFSLNTGSCLEDTEIKVPVWPIRLQGESVEIMQS